MGYNKNSPATLKKAVSIYQVKGIKSFQKIGITL
jgi:hypothetical protein